MAYLFISSNKTSSELKASFLALTPLIKVGQGEGVRLRVQLSTLGVREGDRAIDCSGELFLWGPKAVSMIFPTADYMFCNILSIASI